ncbi:Sec1 domain-containing protein 2 [Phlyctochytrium bullatum]|nr:Sec1 domain-containing protein 2 [Phlyctochytrium bullatum]
MDLVAAARAAFDDLRPLFRGAVVIVDRPFEEVIKWSIPGGFGALLEAGAIAIRQIEAVEALIEQEAASATASASFGAGLDVAGEGLGRMPVTIVGDDPNHIGSNFDVTFVVFLLSSHLARHAPAIRKILCPPPRHDEDAARPTTPLAPRLHSTASLSTSVYNIPSPWSSSSGSALSLAPATRKRPFLFGECRIVAAVSDAAHAAAIEMEPELASEFDAYLGFESYYRRVESKVFAWMVERLGGDLRSGEEPLVSVEHAPLLFATITNELFTIPAVADFFPSFWPREENVTVKSLEAPTSFDRQTRNLAASLCSILDHLNFKEELFVVGDTSRQVARCIISQSGNSARRKSENGIAVVLVDRTLDLATPLSHTDSLLDQMRNVLPQASPRSLDLLLDDTVLLAANTDPDATSAASLVAATLAHGSDPDALDLLTVLAMLGRKDGAVALRKRIVDVVGREGGERPRVLGKVTLAQMERMMVGLVGRDGSDAGRRRERVLARQAGLVQCLWGVVQGIREGPSVGWDEMMAVEKVVALSVAENAEAAAVVSPLRDVVTLGVASSTGGSAGFLGGSASPTPRTSQAMGSPPTTPPGRTSAASGRLSPLPAPFSRTASSSSGIVPSTTTAPAAASLPTGVRDALLLAAFGFSLLGRYVAAGATRDGVEETAAGGDEESVGRKVGFDEEEELLVRDALAKAVLKAFTEGDADGLRWVITVPLGILGGPCIACVRARRSSTTLEIGGGRVDARMRTRPPATARTAPDGGRPAMRRRCVQSRERAWRHVDVVAAPVDAETRGNGRGAAAFVWGQQRGDAAACGVWGYAGDGVERVQSVDVGGGCGGRACGWEGEAVAVWEGVDLCGGGSDGGGGEGGEGGGEGGERDDGGGGGEEEGCGTGWW